MATAMAQEEEEQVEVRDKEKKRNSALPIFYFLAAKLIAYTILGFLLGLLGSVLDFSLTFKLILQFAAIIFMLGTAGNLLNIHPVFRYFIIQPPRFLTRRIRSQAKSRSIFAPAILGAMTVFIPCGTTQAMMALAISSGSAFTGLAILFAFILGTTPIFFILGYFVTRLGDSMQKKFYKVAAVAIILLALYSLNGALALAGQPNFVSAWNILTNADGNSQTVPEGPSSTAPPDNNPTVRITATGYFPRVLNVRAGEPVNIKLTNTDGYGCQQAFVIPGLGYQKIVRPGTTETLQFTAPTQPGQIAFMCSMGMYRGTINVVQ